jgi:DNA replication protein DnaC
MAISSGDLGRGSALAAPLRLLTLPVENWHGIIGDPTIADAIMDRLAFHSHRIEITGDTVRRKLYTTD